MMDVKTVKFIDNPATINSSGRYINITVDVEKILQSWRDSVFSFEWLEKDGSIKSKDSLSEREKPKRERVETMLAQGLPLEKPILGIGLEDNVEIGSGRAEFLTLATQGQKNIPVHVPKSNENDFKDFRADID